MNDPPGGTWPAAGTGTRERFLAGGTHLFRSHGFHAVGVKQIAESCGAPMGSLYHFFPGGKEQIARDSMQRSAEYYDGLLERIFDRYPDMGEAVGTWFRLAAGFLTDSDFQEGCPIGTIADGIATTHDGLRDLAAAIMQSWESRLTERLLALGVDLAEATDYASFVVASFEGAILLARVHRSTTPLERTARVVTSTLQHLVARSSP